MWQCLAQNTGATQLGKVTSKRVIEENYPDTQRYLRLCSSSFTDCTDGS